MEQVELINRIKQGDMRAFEILFEHYKHAAIRTAYLITGNQYTSEDIVQEAFMKCYMSIGELKNPEQFKTWFFRLLTRMAWRHLKKEKKIVPIEDIFEQADKEHSSESIEEFHNQEESRALYEQIAKLGLKHQTVIILYYYNELSVKEIAKVMGCLEGTVKSRLNIARNKLKTSLIELNQKQGIDDKECITYEKYKTVG